MFLQADIEDFDQTWRMPRLIWVFAGRTAILFILSWGGSNVLHVYTLDCIKHGLIRSPSEQWLVCPNAIWENSPVMWPLTLTIQINVIFGPRQANLVLIAYASSEGSGEPAHPRSLARTFAARSYKQWIKRNLQTENQIPGPSEWLGMRS